VEKLKKDRHNSAHRYSIKVVYDPDTKWHYEER
jgi:hypothetical protein